MNLAERIRAVVPQDPTLPDKTLDGRGAGL